MLADLTKPRAFVIMSFDAEALPVYQEFIRPTLADLGFEVFRADDLLNQQNILGDILSSIASADLIVADLTYSNPNVYYELGLAHALGKPVILLGQDIEEIPFDIRSYRLIIYDTHFAKISDARQALEKCAQGFLERKIIFRNPVADFLGREVESQQLPAISAASDSEVQDHIADDRGVIDHIEVLESGYETITSILEEFTTQVQRIGDLTDKAQRHMDEASSQGGAPGRNRIRKIARRLARDLDEFREFMVDANCRYDAAAGQTDTSLEFVLEFNGLAAKDDPSGTTENLASQLTDLREVLEAIVGGKEAFRTLYQSMTEVPPLERHLKRAIASAAQEVQKMTDNVGRTEASVSRAIHVGERIQSGIDCELKGASEAS